MTKDKLGFRSKDKYNWEAIIIHGGKPPKKYRRHKLSWSLSGKGDDLDKYFIDDKEVDYNKLSKTDKRFFESFTRKAELDELTDEDKIKKKEELKKAEKEDNSSFVKMLKWTGIIVGIIILFLIIKNILF